MLLSLLLLACTPPPPGSAPDSPALLRDTAAGDTAPMTPLAEADVVIIGGGGSGIAAAVTALDAGASVLIVERAAALGGSGIYAANLFGSGTRWQRAEGIDDTPEQALEEWAAFTNGGDPEHPWVQGFVRGSAENLEWLTSYGAAFGALGSEPVGSVRRVHSLTPTGKGHPVEIMAALVAEHALLETTGVRLVLDGDAVVGVEVEQADGSAGWVRGRAVIVATGGFARSDARVYAALPQLKALPRHSGARPGSDGNGLDLIESAGGALENLAHVTVYGHSTTDANLGAPEVQVVIGVESGLVVSAAGVRVMNEDHLRTVWGGRAALEHGQLYAIYDAPKWSSLLMTGLGYNYDDVIDGQLSSEAYASRLAVPQAGTLQQLGEALSIDGEPLLRTVSDYNAMLDAGEDTAFGRDTDALQAVRSPPFAALPLAAATGKSFGGAALATDGAVLNADGEAIPGLFAAGEVAGVLGGAHIGMGISGSMAGVIYSGRVAGEGAAAYAQRR